MDRYSEFISRNQGYISSGLQARIRETHLLIAGCGVGSQLAVSAARMGFTRFTLVDGDTVSLSNLNRQAFYHDQIGTGKAAALAENILRINPDCQVRFIDRHFGEENQGMMADVDLVVDTIDFLDLPAIVRLHESAETSAIPLLSGMTIGWGACCVYFANREGKRGQFRRLFGVEEGVPLDAQNYVQKYRRLFEKLQGGIDPKVIEVMQATFRKMSDGEPCAAPQVAGGTYCIASLFLVALARVLEGGGLPQSPQLISIDMNGLVQRSILDIELGA